MRHWSRWAGLLILVFLLAACGGGGSKSGSSADRAEINAIPDKFIQAHLSGDFALMRSLVSDEVELCYEDEGDLICGPPISGDQAAQEAIQVDDPNKTMTVLTREVSISGNNATLRFTMRITYPDDDPFISRVTAELRKTDRWRVYRMIAHE